MAAEDGAGHFEPDEGALFDFRRGDPRGDDADAEAEFDEFLDCLHGAELGELAEGRLEFEEVLLNGAEGCGGAGVEDEVLGVDFAAIDLAGAGPGVEGADEETEVIGKEFVEDEAFFTGGADENAEVDGSIDDLLGDGGGICDGDGEFEFGVAFAEFAERFGDEVLASGGGGADAEGSGAGPGGAFDGFVCGIERGEDAGGVFGKDAAGLGEGNLFSFPTKEGGAEFLLEGGDLVADRGLGQEEGFRRAREA